MAEKDPHKLLGEALRGWVKGDLPSEPPKRWERFSDVVILPSGSFEQPEWGAEDGLWEVVAEALGAERVARMGEVSGDFRESGVEMLLGDDDWVVRKENGVDYGYRMTSCMFSSGNVNERRRMGEVGEEGEVVVDLYAGIGYYTLPLLVNSEISLVHACEWNPEAVAALEWALEKNSVRERCVVHLGDNRSTANDLEGVADRVILGLLPSAEDGLEPALGVLGTGGGTMHIHGLAPSKDHWGWGRRVEDSVQEAGGFSKDSSQITRVKSYAPHWDHVVLDLTLA